MFLIILLYYLWTLLDLSVLYEFSIIRNKNCILLVFYTILDSYIKFLIPKNEKLFHLTIK